MSAIAVLAGVPFLLLIFTGATKRFGPGTGVSDPLRPAALPILMLTLNLSLQIANPVTCAVSRVVEHRADSFGLAITGDRLAMAEAFVSLSKDNLSDPNPPLWVKVLYLDHPPLRERVEFALFDQPIYWPDTSHR
jgi:STE24 endopeptidase